MTSDRIFARHRRVALVAVVAASCVAASIVSAATPTELREERKEVQANAAEIAAEIDAATAEVDVLESALSAAQSNVDAQRAAVEAANRALADAELAQSRATQAIIDLQARQVQARADLQAAAVENYVSFQGFGDLDILSDDPWAATREQTLAEFGTGSGLEGLDELRAIAAELEFQQEIADQATIDAEAGRREMELRLAELDTARLLEEELLTAAVDRQERRLGEAAALAELEAELSEQIRVEEQRIADAIADRLPPGGGSVQLPPDADIELVVVDGITVNVLVEDQVRGILAAMSARGSTSAAAATAASRARFGSDEPTAGLPTTRSGRCRPAGAGPRPLGPA